MLKTSREAHGDVSSADRISNLPAQVIELILSYLPVKDVVRTSILSSEWRHRWVTVPNLVFGGSQFWSIKEAETLASIVDHVLLLHTGSIEIFKIEGICVIPNIGRWVLYLCQGSIKELVLKFCERSRLQHYELPSCLYHCESLVELELSACLLTLPPCFDGFKSLKRLCLKDVTLGEDALEKLFSSCPLLEELTFFDTRRSYDDLKIDAPTLRCLDIMGGFRDFSIGHAMDRMAVFSFYHWPGVNVYSRISLAEFLTNLPNIQRFALKEGTLHRFSFGLTPESVPIQCKDLYHLSIFLDFGCKYERLAALYLLRCSPNLTELEIEVCPEGSASLGLWRDMSECNWEFRKLRWVKLESYNSSSVEGWLDFIQLLLASSPVLETMTLTPCYESNLIHESDVSWNDVKRICGFKRASAKAKIIFDGHLIL